MTVPVLTGLVREAATVFEQRGEAAYPEFREKGSKWFHDDTYLIVWATDGTRVFHATNQEHRRAAYLMDTLALRDRIDGMLHSAALGARKPDSAYFTAATREAEVAPSDVVFIDDVAANIEAARRFGWRAIQWLGDMSLDEAISAAR